MSSSEALLNDRVREQLLPHGVLRAGINLSNFLLVTGRSASGEPVGVSPDLAREIAERLGSEVRYVCYDGPGLLADAASTDAWDIGNIAAEPERARTITFSPAYCEIQASYLVRGDSPFQQVAEVDSAGSRVAVKARSAYDLWLTDNLRHAELVRSESVDSAFRDFVDGPLDAMAGLRPKLLEQQADLPGSRILDGAFTAVQQSVGCRPERPDAAAWLAAFIAESTRNGFIESLIKRHGVTGKLSVAGSG